MRRNWDTIDAGRAVYISTDFMFQNAKSGVISAVWLPLQVPAPG
jgi:hypothetical protein